MPLALTVGALLVALLASAITTLSYLRGVRIAARQINQGQVAVAAVARLVGDAESAERGFLLTGDEQYLQPWNAARNELPGALSRLAGAVGGDPEQSQRVDSLRRLCDEKLDELARAIELKRAGRNEQVLAILHAERGRQLMDQQRRIAREIAEVGERQLDQRRARSDALYQTEIAIVVVAAVGVLVLVALMVAIGRELRQRASLERELASEGDRLREREAELSSALRVNETFTGVLGHDLRNPLSAIRTGSDLISHNPNADQRSQHLAGRIASSADRMSRMIEQILDATRARLGGGIELKPRPVDLAELLREVVEEIRGANPSVELRMQVDGDTNGRWDPDRLAQLLSNLLANAVRHGDSAAGVDLRLDGEQPDRLALDISNQGHIPADVLPVIFEPFRGGGTRRPGSQGLGLGLFIAQQIAQAHKGQVEVITAPTAAAGDGEGGRVTFRVELPRGA